MTTMQVTLIHVDHDAGVCEIRTNHRPTFRLLVKKGYPYEAQSSEAKFIVPATDFRLPRAPNPNRVERARELGKSRRGLNARKPE